MNYIKQLQLEVAQLKAQNQALTNGLNEIRHYLVSPKFSSDTTVQVTDIDNRILEIFSAESDAMDEAYKKFNKIS